MKQILALILLFFTINIYGQKEQYITTTIDGHVLKAIVLDGDTIPMASLDTFKLTTMKSFSNSDERRRYNQARYNALKVYPYAKEAIKLYRLYQEETKDMTNRQRKKYSKAQEKKLSGEYENKLKQLTKLQGYILIKMIERELKTPFKEVISELRGGWAAFKWGIVGRTYGFNLSKGYNPEDDPFLEVILSDLNISYK